MTLGEVPVTVDGVTVGHTVGTLPASDGTIEVRLNPGLRVEAGRIASYSVAMTPEEMLEHLVRWWPETRVLQLAQHLQQLTARKLGLETYRELPDVTVREAAKRWGWVAPE